MTEKKSTEPRIDADYYKRRDKWIDWVLEREDVGTTDRLIGVWLARRMNRNTHDTWYQISSIAQAVGVKPRTVIRAIQALEEMGLIVVRRDGRRGIKKAVNRYELVFPWL